MSTTPAVHPPSPDRKSTTLLGSPLGCTSATLPKRPKVSSFAFDFTGAASFLAASAGTATVANIPIPSSAARRLLALLPCMALRPFHLDARRARNFENGTALAGQQ